MRNGTSIITQHVQAAQILLDLSRTSSSTFQDQESNAPVSSASNSAQSPRITGQQPLASASLQAQPSSQASASADRQSVAVELMNLHAALAVLKGEHILIFQKHKRLNREQPLCIQYLSLTFPKDQRVVIMRTVNYFRAIMHSMRCESKLQVKSAQH